MISIVVPVYNQHEMTRECLAAVRAHTRDFELILIDNGSEPEFTTAFTPEAPGALIRNTTNLGFPAAVNQGIRAAKGNVVVLLNNDVIVTPEALNRLASWLDAFSIVGPLTNYCAGMQRVQIPIYQDLQELCTEADKWGQAHAGEIQPVNWLIGFCMAFRRSLFDELGPFDESRWPSSGEEIDFCFRARAAGHLVGIARDVYVHHAGSQTFMAMHEAGQLDYGAVCKMTEDHLATKWGADFWTRQEEAVRGSTFEVQR